MRAVIEIMSERAGRVVDVQPGPEGYSAFVPAPLPPDPPVRIDSRTQALLDEANQALGRLCGASSRALCRTRTGDPFLTIEHFPAICGKWRLGHGADLQDFPD